MEIRVLLREQYRGIYENWMQEDFAADELKPLSVMYELHDRGIYEGYGLYDGDNMVGYAFVVMGDTPCALLDYLAVCREFRNGGFGGTFLSLLMKRLQQEHRATRGLILETERVDAGNSEEERRLRRRRIGFYERNQFIRTEMHCILFGVAFTVMYRPALKVERPLSEHEIYEELKRLYQVMGIWGSPEKIILEEKP